MANLRDIKKRISSVTTTKQITRTMEMVSTAKIRRALDRSKQAEPYKEALTDVMLTVAGDASCSGTDPMLQKHESVKHGLIVVIASDRGLAGGFNTTVERTAEKLAASWANDGVECEIIACGRKPATYFRDRENVVMHFEGNSSEPDFNQARMISSHICDAYRAGELDRVELVYHHAKNRVDQELRVEHLLPLDPEMIAMAHGPRKNETDAQLRRDHPLLSMLQTIPGEALSIVGYANVRDTAAINKLIYSHLAKQVLPSDLRLLWSAKPADGLNQKNVFELHALKITTSDGRPVLEGDVVTDAKDQFDQYGKPEVSMSMNSEGAREWSAITKANLGKAVAIVLDGVVYTAPRINSQIDGGQSSISGNFTIEDTKDLANTLKSGRMPAPARIVQEEVVGPTLGAQSIQQGLISFVIAFVVLMIYMLLMYDIIPGMMANVALLANLFFTLGILASFQSALTMPGIAGIVLTLGTAVDANVLIYERIKEEMRGGKGIKEALEAGYKNAFSAIFDSNLTSLITGIILLVTGTGPIRGFATTWIIGLCCSFFTAVFLTRIVYEKQMAKNRWLNQKFYTSISKNLMQNVNFGFMKMSKKSFTLCGIAAVVFIGSFAIRGLSQSIDFTGGRNYVVTLNKATEVESVRELLDGAFVNTTGTDAGKQATTSVIALGTDGKTIRVSTNYNIESNDPMEDDRAETILYNALHKAGFVSQANVEAFKNPDIRTGGSIISSAKVGPSVAKDITYGAIISVALALFFIFLYILLRFRNLGFSVGSIVALFFDTLTVVGIYSLCWGWMPFSLEIDQTFIGAILTVIGYSINDKVVVFDRIRENLKLHPKQDRESLFNSSINQTLARTINTSASTLIVLLCIFFLGGESIRSFSFAMILGVVFGTLSSIFIASPVAYMVLKRKTIDTNEVAKA